jgi:transposase
VTAFFPHLALAVGVSDDPARSEESSGAPSHERLVEMLAERDAQIAELARVNAGLRAEIAELKARLGADSSNSSMPPSREGLAKKPAQPRRKGGRPGKRRGDPGKHLAQVADPDEIVEHTPATCEGCDGDLAGAPVVGTASRQVFDIPPLRLRVTEHRVARRRCGCGHVTAAAFPDEATAPACYGPGVRALIVYLAVAQHLPVDRTARLLADVLGAPVSTGTVTNVIAQAARIVAAAVAVIAARLRAAPVVHFDETGARIAGKLHWVHVACTGLLTLLLAHPRRGTEAIDAAGILPEFRGIAVHDGWAPYRSYDKATHASCNAHHLRDLQATAEAGHDWAEHLAQVLPYAWRRVIAAKAAGRDTLPADVLASVRARYDGHVAQGLDATADRPKSDPARLARRLARHRDDTLRFTTDFAVPFDNNQAERDIRMTKLQQKISGCWRTLPGAQAFCTIRSYTATAHKHGTNTLDALHAAFTGQPWIPPATAT